eukprot:evm.model.scf_32EXC.3 EVM.evm.TU.scf_32EXC.3   scf_32EXC:102007-113257(-)
MLMMMSGQDGDGTDDGDEDSDDEIAEGLATSIEGADIEGTAGLLLSTNNTEALARGLRIPAGLVPKESADRETDGDVIAMKAVAKAVLVSDDDDEAERLADVILESAFPGFSRGSVVLPSDDDDDSEDDDLRENLVESLLDKNFLQQIVEADPNEDDANLGRRLQCFGCGDSRSWVCAQCWPKKFCKSFWYCKGRGKTRKGV